MVNRSIEFSGLLITPTLHHYKHQLRDFFNRHACLRQLIMTVDFRIAMIRPRLCLTLDCTPDCRMALNVGKEQRGV